MSITPPVGIPLSGFAGRGPSCDVHDDLTATALVLTSPEDAAPGVAIVGADLVGIDDGLTRRIQHQVAQRTGMAPGSVLICCSHTHYGPTGTLDATIDITQRQAGPADQTSMVRAYIDNLVNLVAGIVTVAIRRLAPCRMWYAETESHIGVNRRQRLPDGTIVLGQNPDGPCDRRVALLRIDTVDGQPVGTVVNAACHGVSLGGHCTDMSADFVGITRNLVENETGGLCLFLQGAAGNINPTLIGWDWGNPLRIGARLAAAVLDAYWSPTLDGAATATNLAVASSRMQLPPMLPTSIDAAESEIADLEARIRELKAASDRGPACWAAARIARLRRGLEHLHGRTEMPPLPADVVGARLGDDIALITTPAEPFTELGEALIGKAPFPHTLYAGYTNGMVGYVPTPEAYGEGGYEVNRACHVAPEAAGLLEREQLTLLHRLRDIPPQP